MIHAENGKAKEKWDHFNRRINSLKENYTTPMILYVDVTLKFQMKNICSEKQRWNKKNGVCMKVRNGQGRDVKISVTLI